MVEGENMANMLRRTTTRLAIGISASLLLAASLLPAYAHASSCPPAGVMWSNNAKFTGEPDNYGGSFYILNNNQYNEQSNSSQTIYLTSTGGTWGLCGVYQPSSPSEVKSYPSISMTSDDKLGNAWKSYHTIGFSYTQNNFASASGDWQTMADMFLNATTGSNAFEVEFITNRHEVGSPSGSLIGTYYPSGDPGPAWDVYENTSRQNPHSYFAFVPQSNANTGTVDLQAAFRWLSVETLFNGSVVFPANAPLVSFSYGPEIADIQNSSTSGPTGGFRLTSFTAILN